MSKCWHFKYFAARLSHTLAYSHWYVLLIPTKFILTFIHTVFALFSSQPTYANMPHTINTCTNCFVLFYDLQYSLMNTTCVNRWTLKQKILSICGFITADLDEIIKSIHIAITCLTTPWHQQVDGSPCVAYRFFRYY